MPSLRIPCCGKASERNENIQFIREPALPLNYLGYTKSHSSKIVFIYSLSSNIRPTSVGTTSSQINAYTNFLVNDSSTVTVHIHL